MIQIRLRNKAALTDWFDPIERVGGVEASYLADEGTCLSACSVLSFPTLDMLDEQYAAHLSNFPYVPGLLAFREGPSIAEVLNKIKVQVNLLMIAAHGYSHPRRIGLATHIGILFDIPSIGVAKSALCGRYEEPGFAAGSYSFLTDEGEVIGAVVRTRTGAEPVFVSVGHRVRLETAIDIVLKCCKDSRFPKPLEYAHAYVRRAARSQDTR